MYYNRILPDIVPGTALSTEEASEFAGLVDRNWGAAEELTAEQAQLASAARQLAHVRWLRDVRLP